MIRIDHHDVVYKTEGEKFDAVIEEISDCHERGQPVLVGTVSIEKSERVAETAQKDRRQALRAQREEPRARGRNRRAGRPLRRGHDFDQHGRPRHRYRARRQSGVHGGGGSRHRATRTIRISRRRSRKYGAAMRGASASRCSRPAACTSSAPSGTSRGASTTSCAAARDARAIPARRDFTCRSKTTCCASSAPTGSRA